LIGPISNIKEFACLWMKFFRLPFGGLRADLSGFGLLRDRCELGQDHGAKAAVEKYSDLFLQPLILAGHDLRA
jgi:hypothetical protein